MNILVVEDHSMEMKLVTHVLSAAGNQVDGFGSAEEAFEAVRRNRPDLILLDIALPGMDGFALVRLLREDPETRNLLIVVVTTFPEKYSKAEAFKAGCDAYLVKPISTRTLPEDLEMLVRLRNGDDPLP